MHKLIVVGAGLAGCEAANTAARLGAEVELIEMKPERFSPAHENPNFAELVCSNSLKAARLDSAAGLLKEEMRRFGSVCLDAAETCKVAAGGALAVDREAFAEAVTRRIRSNPRITVRQETVKAPDFTGAAVIATGPLTDGGLADQIAALCGEKNLSFFDAAAPIVTAESVDLEKAFFASRYEENGRDYINCPFDKEGYERFHAALISAETAPLREFEANRRVYEGCMPIEVLARRGLDAVRYGPMKPVGLRNPRTGHRPWAAVQLRRENREATLLNIVGFQTNLKFPEQKRVFSMIPGLERAEFVRYGVMHRNTFLNAPAVLNADLSLKARDNLFFAGQITGVEGYMESAACGILAGINAVRRLRGEEPLILPRDTMMGALAAHLRGETGTADFQPMGANFGILPPLEIRIRDKKERYAALSKRSLSHLEEFLKGEES